MPAVVLPAKLSPARSAHSASVIASGYLALLDGRERVKAILADRRASGSGMGEEEAMRLAVQEQHASRR
jgi:hypothetical protein